MGGCSSDALGHKVSGFFFELALLLIRIMPYPLFRGLAFLITRVLYLVSARLRKNALESLGIAYGESLTLKERRQLSAASFDNLALGIADFIYALEHPAHVRRMFVVEGREHLDAAMRQGQGAVIAIGHFGPFVAMIFRLMQEGYPSNVVLRAPRSLFLKEKFLEAKQRFGLGLIYSVPVRSCLTECGQALKRGEVVFMPIDQNYGAAGRIFVDFFGRKAGTAPGPVLYGVKSGTPTLTALAVPAGRGRWTIRLSPPIEIKKQSSEKEMLIYHSQVLTSALEAMIRDYPEQWSWMHRRWKAEPKQGEI